MNQSYEDVFKFWFGELKPADWFKKDDTLDNKIRDRFQVTHNKATSCELHPWRTKAQGALCEIIVLDQFSRNIYRGSAKSFAADPLALALAQEAIRRDLHQKLTPTEQSFMFMPFMHSESLVIHEQAVALFSGASLENNLKFELMHKKIIERFGRYPHRNEILGRKSTAAEIEFLNEPGSSF